MQVISDELPPAVIPRKQSPTENKMCKAQPNTYTKTADMKINGNLVLPCVDKTILVYGISFFLKGDWNMENKRLNPAL